MTSLFIIINKSNHKIQNKLSIDIIMTEIYNKNY